MNHVTVGKLLAKATVKGERVVQELRSSSRQLCLNWTCESAAQDRVFRNPPLG